MAHTILVTGPIASGKSTLTTLLKNAFEAEGDRVLIIEADAVAKEYLWGAHGPTKELKLFFGKNTFEEGSGWNFPLISEILFGDEMVYRDFQSLFGQGVREVLSKKISEAEESLAYDIILVESANPSAIVDASLCFFVHCPAEIRLERARARGKAADGRIRDIIRIQEKFPGELPPTAPTYNLSTQKPLSQEEITTFVANLPSGWKKWKRS